MLKKFVSIIIALVLVLQCNIKTNYAAFITMKYPILRETCLVGDSYSYFVCVDTGMDLCGYTNPGFTVKDLRECFDASIVSGKKYINIFIGPNDYRNNISVENFKQILSDKIFNFIRECDSIIIISSYLDSIYSNILYNEGVNKTPLKAYDYVLQELSTYDDRIYYLDINDLNRQHEFLRDDEDIIHFNQDFSKIYIERLVGILEAIRGELPPETAKVVYNTKK